MSPTVSGLRRRAAIAFAALPRPAQEVAFLPWRARAERELRSLGPMGYAARRLYVGPWNTAGQGWEWARAVERHLPHVAAQNLFALRTAAQTHFNYPADHEISVVGQRGRVRKIHGERVLREATHVLFESGRPVLGNFHGGSMLDDLPALEDAGIRSAVVYHGSEIRDLREHAERFPHSPFRGEWDDYFGTLQLIVDRNLDDLEQFEGPVLVSTPDQVPMVPRSVWLPLVVDVDRFASEAPLLERERPVVLHAPSNPRLKGGETVREQMEELAARDLIEYRLLQGVGNAQMPAAIAGADIVLDQFALGATGVFAAEAQAAGRVVLAHVTPEVREMLAAADPEGAPPPVVEATPQDVGQVVEQVVAERDRFRELAAAAPAWVRRNHDGRRSAQVLADTLLR
ncbi:glycosyltransferase [Ornithinimicrobium panacihumi]|uniref:glycosyltransferase n=1 Tax=Ornithinimicrobium panacihumi TaxID=2008449 RepID=UPI003F8C18AD